MKTSRLLDLLAVSMVAGALWYGTAFVLAYKFSSTYWACWMVGC